MEPLYSHRDRYDHIRELIVRLNELDTMRDPTRRTSKPQSEPLDTDSPAVVLAKAHYKEIVSAAKTVYDLAFISALENWIVALESEEAP